MTKTLHRAEARAAAYLNEAAEINPAAFRALQPASRVVGVQISVILPESKCEGELDLMQGRTPHDYTTCDTAFVITLAYVFIVLVAYCIGSNLWRLPW